MTEGVHNELERLELKVPESDTKDLLIIDGTDLGFAIIYTLLFFLGLGLTLAAI